MKYYINREKEMLLKDENNTPYLTARGYEEITKEEFEEKQKEFIEKHKKRRKL